MADIIQLLPDSVANQIAAGEVIQRPASAVKELMENAIDAGGTSIKLIIKDAGKALIQVIDNGKGMSVTDARMSFERHATSKIKKVDDIFSIRTMGFRGEALASIAAIAQVELKSRRAEDELGTQILIEGSKILQQTPMQAPLGTSIAVKNLFYNVPARRNFLKSNPIELKHIYEEFQRVALAHPEIAFELLSDGEIKFQLPAENLKVRMVQIFGKGTAERIAEIEEQTDLIEIKGFIGFPSAAKKTRGEQYFFVNNRFIKDAYLNHAVLTAYEGLLPADSFPSYVLDIEIDPAKIDVNVHPTKTEIKFENEKMIYAILRAAVKRSLGVHNITPSIDFEASPDFNQYYQPMKHTEIPDAPRINLNPEYNPFAARVRQPTMNLRDQHNAANWETIFENTLVPDTITQSSLALPEEKDIPKSSTSIAFQLHQKWIVSPVKSGLMIIDQVAAHERILYERFLAHLLNSPGHSQQSLFPQTLNLSAPDFALVTEMLAELKALGFELREFGNNTFVLEGIPAEISDADGLELIEKLLENFKELAAITKIDRKENLAKSLARQAAIKAGKFLSAVEMQSIIDELFSCSTPSVALNGGKTLTIITAEELGKKMAL